MEDLIANFTDLLKKGARFVASSTEEDLKFKPSSEVWSKKEIIGHLIDSGIANLQRFTEIQFENRPYKIRGYNQNELVKSNSYNEADPLELLGLWLSINERIIQVVKVQNESTLSYQIELGNGEISDFKFLIKDYVVHLEHHLNQIMN
ncbi:DinB family protein [Aquimarina sediminis]|uniref:DinB family protein n=1 Tax=Aquimarina sediminis TaxID=2070536 RepID=UPI000CA02C3B|nr:DinB family protein [Aquimarina sediminis]